MGRKREGGGAGEKLGTSYILRKGPVEKSVEKSLDLPLMHVLPQYEQGPASSNLSSITSYTNCLEATEIPTIYLAESIFVTEI